MKTQKARMSPQKAQMTQIDLDQAIDHVVRRMTHVDEDSTLAARIVAALPERRARWFSMPRLAFGVLAALAIVAFAIVQTNIPTFVPTVVQTNVPAVVPAVVPAIVPTNVPTNVRVNARMNGRMNVRMNVRINDRVSDHPFSLPALDVPAALAVNSLIPSALPEEDPLTVSPLAIEPLALDPVQR